MNQLHSNAVLQGETLMMLKEYFIERYGVPKWMVGNGGSGGAIQQLLITQMFPGLLDGLQPTVAFPDSSLHTSDCGLLQNYCRKVDPNVWTDAKKQAVEGFTKGTCPAWERSFVPVLTATNVRGCALNDVSKVYDPVKNPKGARCTVQEMRVNIYGRDPKTGFARRPQDNVQYAVSGAQRAAARGRRAACERRREAQAEADRLSRLQGELHGRAEAAHEQDLSGQRVRLLEAGRRAGEVQGHVSDILTVRCADSARYERAGPMEELFCDLGRHSQAH